MTTSALFALTSSISFSRADQMGRPRRSSSSRRALRIMSSTVVRGQSGAGHQRRRCLRSGDGPLQAYRRIIEATFRTSSSDTKRGHRRFTSSGAEHASHLCPCLALHRSDQLPDLTGMFGPLILPYYYEKLERTCELLNLYAQTIAVPSPDGRRPCTALQTRSCTALQTRSPHRRKNCNTLPLKRHLQSALAAFIDRLVLRTC